MTRVSPYIIAVTGTIGSGKSLVGKILEQSGVPVLDSDIVVHNLLSSDTIIKKKIRARFGESVVVSGNDTFSINRKALGSLVFNDLTARHDLEKIVHPAVFKCADQWLLDQNKPIVAQLIPLLFEAGRPKNYNKIWAVICDESILRERLKKRSGLSDSDIDLRLQAQLSQAEKSQRANHTIDNSGTEESTARQVHQLLGDIRQIQDVLISPNKQAGEK